MNQCYYKTLALNSKTKVAWITMIPYTCRTRCEIKIVRTFGLYLIWICRLRSRHFTPKTNGDTFLIYQKIDKIGYEILRTSHFFCIRVTYFCRYFLTIEKEENLLNKIYRQTAMCRITHHITDHTAN